MTLSEMIATIEAVVGKSAIIDCQPDAARVARRWSARSAGPGVFAVVLTKAGGVTEAGAFWALREQQPGDVPQTWADVSQANELIGYEPTTTFKDGVAKFYDWWQTADV